MIGKKLNEEDILVTRDVSSLYPNIQHNEGISAINKSLEEAQINSLKKTVYLQTL